MAQRKKKAPRNVKEIDLVAEKGLSTGGLIEDRIDSFDVIGPDYVKHTSNPATEIYGPGPTGYYPTEEPPIMDFGDFPRSARRSKLSNDTNIGPGKEGALKDHIQGEPNFEEQLRNVPGGKHLLRKYTPAELDKIAEQAHNEYKKENDGPKAEPHPFGKHPSLTRMPRKSDK